MTLNTLETTRMYHLVMAKYRDYINPNAYWKYWTGATVERTIKRMQIPLVNWRQVRFGELANIFNRIQEGKPI